MARGKKIDPEILVRFANRWSQAPDRTEQGEIVREFASSCGISVSTAYNKLGQMRKGLSPLDVAAAKVPRRKRKSKSELELERKHAKKVHAIKFGQGKGEVMRYGASTELALHVCENMGVVPRGLYSVTKMDRILRREGLNLKAYHDRNAAHKLTAQYPGHVFAVDASPMNHYYLRLDGSVVPYDFPHGDTHKEDILERERLQKIWVYYLVDLYSGAFLIRAFAPEPRTAGARKGGENAEDWLTFLRWAFLAKQGSPSPLENRTAPLRDCPVEGLPDILFCDKGSGIGNSSLVKRFIHHLDSRIETHLPNQPSAKGCVESRIGANKRGPEAILNRHTVNNINQLNYFYQAWTADINRGRNRKRGAWPKWKEAIKERPVRRVTEENYYDAMTVGIERTIDNYGCVSIESKPWFVAFEGEHIGTRVQIFKPPVRPGEQVRYLAELNNGVVVPLEEGRREHDFEDIKTFGKTQAQINRDEARMEGKELRRIMLFEDTLPNDPAGDPGVLSFPNPGRVVDTEAIVPPAKFLSIESARLWIYRKTGLEDDQLNRIAGDIIPIIEDKFSVALEAQGHIPAELVLTFCNTLTQFQQVEENKNRGETSNAKSDIC